MKGAPVKEKSVKRAKPRSWAQKAMIDKSKLKARLKALERARAEGVVV